MTCTPLDKKNQYVYRIGSDNQYRFYWSEGKWRYELLAGSVLFDEQQFETENDLIDALSSHGMTIDQFSPELDHAAEKYSEEIKKKMALLVQHGIDPCPKHGLSAKNLDGSCEACQNQDYPDDFKGTEG